MHRIFTTPVASVYPHYVAKAERKGRTQAEVDAIITWLTGFDEVELRHHLDAGTTFADFFDQARLNPAASTITGSVCGVRVQDVADPLMQRIRYLDKLVDELARGRPMARVLRSSSRGRRLPRLRSDPPAGIARHACVVRHAEHVHSCPCCGYRTLPSRGSHDLCPVCWWDDDGGQPWEISGPNGTTLVEAQQTYLSETRRRRRRGGPRAPRPDEAREPGWQPLPLTQELRARVRDSHEQEQREREQWARESAAALAADPEGPFREHNRAVDALRERAPTLTHGQVEAELRELGRVHGTSLPEAYVELFARRLVDEHYYRRHPVRGAWWLLRTARPGTMRQTWHALRTGSVLMAG